MLKDKMLAVMADVGRQAAEREDLIEAIAVALLTRKNLFILGDTGQAKSFVINEFRKRVTGAKQFERLLSKETNEGELFGRPDLASLIPGNAGRRVLEQDAAYTRLCGDLQTAYGVYGKLLKDGPRAEAETAYGRVRDCREKLEACRAALYALHGNQPVVNTAGKIPESHIIFLDEIFKANDGILNSLLTALNERRYTNEGSTVDIPAISFFAASNEIPNFNDAAEKILKALYDRLELKLVTEYVQSRDARLGVLADKQTGRSGQIKSAVTLEALYAMQEAVSAVTIPDAVNALMDDILCELRDKGAHISDRKYFGYYPLAQAMAWLKGRDSAEAQDLMILRHYLWTNPEERTVVNQVLERKCLNPLKDALDDILRMGIEAYGEFEGAAAADIPKRIGKLRNEFLTLYEMLSGLLAKAQNAAETGQINDALNRLEDYSKKAHATVSYTYNPLNELYEFRRTA
ncbi:MAG: AAA family ATPase [Oscillospiraceae bacterium]|jgi:MoxR-like ATPase|nr:AAA family ATPase [Oscillospiraceae bacterium]